MSETETNKGTLVPITNLPDISTEDNAREICSRLGFEKGKYHESWMECLEDRAYRQVHFRDGIFYEIRNTRMDDDFEIIEGTKNEDGSYDYFLRWYNGGASMSEVLDDAIDKADREE